VVLKKQDIHGDMLKELKLGQDQLDIVLGLDIGTQSTGYSVLNAKTGHLK